MLNYLLVIRINCNFLFIDAITFLLQKIGTYVNPQLMVERIDPKMNIPGLKKALVKMMHDYNLQVSVQEGCKKILSSDYFNLHERLVRCHQKGIVMDGKCFVQLFFQYLFF